MFNHELKFIKKLHDGVKNGGGVTREKKSTLHSDNFPKFTISFPTNVDFNLSLMTLLLSNDEFYLKINTPTLKTVSVLRKIE